MSAKREPTLADRAVAARKELVDNSSGFMKPSWVHSQIDSLVLAKKFVLDASAVQYMGEMLREHPRIVADAQDFALRPFENMWVEFPARPFYYAVTGRYSDKMSDQTIGYLFRGPVVTTYMSGPMHGDTPESMIRHPGTPEQSVGLLPIEYIMHRPMQMQEQLELAQKLGTSRMALDLWFWGETAASFAPTKFEDGQLTIDEQSDDQWNKEALRSLRDNHSVRTSGVLDTFKNETIDWSRVMDGSAGDLRNIIAVLLFLNRTQDIQFVREEGMARGMIKRKPGPLYPHRTISFRLNPMPRLRKLAAGAGLKRRLHDVRGHYCHDKRARFSGCQHGTELRGDFGEWWIEYKPLHWRCEECKGERWWRNEHSRGNLEIGMTVAQYAVSR